VIALRADLKSWWRPPDRFSQIGAHAVGAGERSTAHEPYCGDVFVFRSKRMDRVKLLAGWQRHGVVTKWLHEGRFTWPPIRDGLFISVRRS